MDTMLTERREAFIRATSEFDRVKRSKLQGVSTGSIVKDREHANRASAAASRAKVMRYSRELETRTDRLETERNHYMCLSTTTTRKLENLSGVNAEIKTVLRKLWDMKIPEACACLFDSDALFLLSAPRSVNAEKAVDVVPKRKRVTSNTGVINSNSNGAYRPFSIRHHQPSEIIDVDSPHQPASIERSHQSQSTGVPFQNIHRARPPATIQRSHYELQPGPNTNANIPSTAVQPSYYNHNHYHRPVATNEYRPGLVRQPDSTKIEDSRPLPGYRNVATGELQAVRARESTSTMNLPPAIMPAQALPAPSPIPEHLPGRGLPPSTPLPPPSIPPPPPTISPGVHHMYPPGHYTYTPHPYHNQQHNYQYHYSYSPVSQESARAPSPQQHTNVYYPV